MSKPQLRDLDGENHAGKRPKFVYFRKGPPEPGCNCSPCRSKRKERRKYLMNGRQFREGYIQFKLF